MSASLPSHSGSLPQSPTGYAPPGVGYTHPGSASVTPKGAPDVPVAFPADQQAYHTSTGPALQGVPSAASVQGIPVASGYEELHQRFSMQGVHQGLPPGSPLTQTARSDGGSMYARFQEQHRIPSAHFTANFEAQPPATLNTHGHAGASPLPSDAKKSIGPAGFGETPGSEPPLSLFGGDPGDHGFEAGGRAFGGFSAFPPLATAPSADLLSKLAYSDAKVKQLELQLEDQEQRSQQRLQDGKQQADAEHERMELQCGRFEQELDRAKDIHAGDLRHLNESKQLVLQNFEMEKEAVRREERRRAQLELEKLRMDHSAELEDVRRKHERSLMIAQQQAEMEAESLRRSSGGEEQLARLVQQVQGAVFEVEKSSKQVHTDKSLEWQARERQLEARERNVREMETRLSSQNKEVEDQRRKVSELVRHMEDSQTDDRTALASERERLTAEHARLLELQRTVRENDRNNKESLKHGWSQFEDEKRTHVEEQLRVEGDLQSRKDEIELQERHSRQDDDRLKTLNSKIETARQNAARRIRETETTIAGERRCLMSDLEVFEEKRRVFASEVVKLESERQQFEGDKASFEDEVKNVGMMAAEVQRKSEELNKVHVDIGAERNEMQRFRDQLQEERQAQGSELDRLKTMQTLVEQQRLQLLQTENQIRVRGIEDMELMISSQTTMQADGTPPLSSGFDTGLQGALQSYSTLQGAMQGAQQEPVQALSQDPFAQLQAQIMGQAQSPLNGQHAMHGLLAASGKQPQFQSPPQASTATAKSAARKRTVPTPNRQGVGNRLESQTLLRRTREASGEMQVYIQEQYRFLQHDAGVPSFARDHFTPPLRPPAFAAPQAASVGGHAPPPLYSSSFPTAPRQQHFDDDPHQFLFGEAHPQQQHHTLEALLPLTSDYDAPSGSTD